MSKTTMGADLLSRTWRWALLALAVVLVLWLLAPVLAGWSWPSSALDRA